jgi:hypothetical protein
MPDEADKLWAQVAKELARRCGFATLTPEQAQKEFEALPDEHLSEGEITSIMDRVISGKFVTKMPAPIDSEEISGSDSVIEEDIYQLNRNAGESDPETERLLDELRRKALGDGEDDGDEHSTGLDGTPQPPG